MSEGMRGPHTNKDVGDPTATYPAPEPVQSSFEILKERIRNHYELCSDYYYSLWGEHIHHGYFLKPEDTKEVAQVQLIELLLRQSGVPKGSDVLDVGCGIGGTCRYLAKEHGCTVTGITISGQQVQMARRLSRQSAPTSVSSQSTSFAGTPASSQPSLADDGFDLLGQGKVKFIELDAEKMGEHFAPASYDVVWISEAMSHLPNKQLFFENAHKLLRPGGKLVIADWFKAEDLTPSQMSADIQPIEDGMLLPPLCTQQDYTNFAKRAGLSVLAEPMDISKQVAKTWDISTTLVSSPSLWALAFTQGRDFIAFLQAFKAMRRGYANGTFRYGVMALQK